METVAIILLGCILCLKFITANPKGLPLTLQHWLRGHGPYHNIEHRGIAVCQCGKIVEECRH